MSATRVATVRADVTSDRKQAGPGLSVTTLMIASLSSLAAALVVSKLWGGGTLIGAAMTPVIVALVSEGLRRPATVITTVRVPRSGRYDPVAEGRAGLREGDLERARAPVPAAAAAKRRVHRAEGRAMTGGGLRLRLPRPRVIAAVVTGLVAFVVAGVVLTGSELVLGKSVVSSSKRTTYIPVKRNTSTTGDEKSKTTSTEKTTTTTTPTTSTAAPATTTTAPPAATTTAPATPPTVSTAPPAPQTSTVPTAPAPAPNATPPASTTP
jgi:hypothetical protein